MWGEHFKCYQSLTACLETFRIPSCRQFGESDRARELGKGQAGRRREGASSGHPAPKPSASAQFRLGPALQITVRFTRLIRHQGGFVGAHLPRLTCPRTREGPTLCLMLRCHHLEILKHFQMRVPAFALRTVPHKPGSCPAPSEAQQTAEPPEGRLVQSGNALFITRAFPSSIFIHQGIFEEMSLIPGTLIHLHQLSLFRGDLGVM